MYSNSTLVFSSVPSDLIATVSLSPSNPNETVGDSVTLTCTATLSIDVSGAMIEFDYGSITTNTIAAVSGTSQTDIATISSVSISFVGEYTCTVTVTAPGLGVCGGGGPEPACPTKTSSTVSLTVHCE